MFKLLKQDWLICAISFIFSFSAYGQNQDYVHIDDIIIEGNNKTKNVVILKELTFKENQKIPVTSISELLTHNENRVLSTGLFNSVKLNIKNWDTEKKTGEIHISVSENWYIFPSWIFELADRNFNVWWKDQNRSLERVNYGLKLSHYNLTGYRDALKLKMQFGYTRKFEAVYSFPFITENFGAGFSVFYSDNKEIGYITIENKTLFQKAEDERLLLKRFRSGAQFFYRPSTHLFSGFRLELHRNAVNPFVIEELNPAYFLNGRTSIKFFFAEFDVQYDKRIYNLYPQGGYTFFANVKKEGFGIFNEYNNFSITGGWEVYTKLNKRTIIGNRTKAKTNITRRDVSFANNTGLGWDSDIVSGFELYVMDGKDFIIFINNLKYQLLNQDLNTVSWLPSQLKRMNVKLALRLNFDFAYVNEPVYYETNTINNRWFFGYGPALDLILFNNYLFSFEYSFNDLGESAYFLHSSRSF